MEFHRQASCSLTRLLAYKFSLVLAPFAFFRATNHCLLSPSHLANGTIAFNRQLACPDHSSSCLSYAIENVRQVFLSYNGSCPLDPFQLQTSSSSSKSSQPVRSRRYAFFVSSIPAFARSSRLLVRGSLRLMCLLVSQAKELSPAAYAGQARLGNLIARAPHTPPSSQSGLEPSICVSESLVDHI